MQTPSAFATEMMLCSTAPPERYSVWPSCSEIASIVHSPGPIQKTFGSSGSGKSVSSGFAKMCVAWWTLPLYTTVYCPGSVTVKRTVPSAISGTMPAAVGSTSALSTSWPRPGIRISTTAVPSKSK